MDLLGQALDRATNQRAAWTEAACAGDQSLCDDVMRLLAQQTSAAQFLEESPLAAAVGTEKSDARSLVGDHIGSYKIISEIGRGGMGTVYLAARDDQQFTRRVAVKLIKRGMDTDFVVQRFRNERQILANLDHPNIARLIDGGATEADLPYFIMEYVEGQPITEYANANDLTTTERLKLFRTVCSAAQYAHQNLVIHRDIKPSNILVTKDGEPKLLDFGIAKLLQVDTSEEAELTATAVRVMTPEYASPEQVKGERVSTATDVYSLGVLLYELLTGRRPYRVKSRQPEEIAKAICEQEPEKPSQAISRQPSVVSRQRDGQRTNPIIKGKSLRGDLDNIVLMALRKEPTRRYASVEQFSEDIRRHLEGLPVIARQATLSYRTSKFVRRNKLGVAAAALVLLTLGGGIVATTVEARRANRRFNDVRRLAHSVLFDYHDQIAALPGSTKVRERLVKDSLEYLDNLSQEAGSDRPLMRELAAAYEKVAAVQGGIAVSNRGTLLSESNLGDTRGAIASLGKALVLRERLAVLEPNNRDIRNELADCYVGLGGQYLFTGPPEKAVEYQRKAIPLVETSLAADPANERLQYELFGIYLGMAKALGNPAVANLGDTQGALEFMNKAQLLAEKLVADHPTDVDYQVALGSFYNLSGSMLGAIGKEKEALESELKAVAIDQRLVDRDSSNTMLRRELAVQVGNAGGSMLKLGDNFGALEKFKQAVTIYESLVAADPNDANIRRNSAVGYRNLGSAVGTSNVVEALSAFHKALQIFAELTAKDPNNADFRRQWAFTYLSLSRFQPKADDLDGAVDSAIQGIKIDEALVASSPTNASARNTLALLYSQLGASHTALAAKAGTSKQTAQWQAAKDSYQKSLDIYQDMKSNGTLKGADAGKPDELAKEIAKCDAVLERVKAK
jgi:serine/threonine protein kinase/tetratricopeptide (TPR) repeat protein